MAYQLQTDSRGRPVDQGQTQSKPYVKPKADSVENYNFGETQAERRMKATLAEPIREYTTPAHNYAPKKKAEPAAVTAGAPAMAGPTTAPVTEMGGGGGGSVSLEGYEPTLRSQLNPNLGRRLQGQAFSALASVRKPY